MLLCVCVFAYEPETLALRHQLSEYSMLSDCGQRVSAGYGSTLQELKEGGGYENCQFARLWVRLRRARQQCALN